MLPNTHRSTSSAIMPTEETGKHMCRLQPTHKQAVMRAHCREPYSTNADISTYTLTHSHTPTRCTQVQTYHAQLKTTHSYGPWDTWEQSPCAVLPAPPCREGGLDFQPYPNPPELCSGALCWGGQEQAAGPSLALELSRLDWGFGGKMKRKAKRTRASSQASCLLWVQMTFCSLQPRLKERFLLQRSPLGSPSFCQNPGPHYLSLHAKEGVLTWLHHIPAPPLPGQDFFTLLHSRSSTWLTLLTLPTWIRLQLGAQPPCHPLGL